MLSYILTTSIINIAYFYNYASFQKILPKFVNEIIEI